MARNKSAAPAEGRETTGSIPIGGNAAKVDAPHLEHHTEKWDAEPEVVSGEGGGAAPEAIAKIRAQPDEQAKLDTIRAKLRGEATTPAAEPAGEAKPAAAAEGDVEKVEATAEGETATETTTETKTPVVPKRRDLIAKIGEERRRLELETQLKDERGKREALETQLKQGSALQILQARGMTREQALEELLTKPEDAVEEKGKPAAKDPEVEALKKRLDDAEARTRANDMSRALQVVENAVKDLDAPLVRAAKRIPVPKDDGSVRMVSGYTLVLETAHALAQQAGDRSNPAMYLATAAQLVEEQLAEEQKELFEAFDAKRSGKKPAVAAEDKGEEKPKAKPAPSLGRRMAGGQNKEVAGGGLPLDTEERRLEIKKRMGWS